MESLINVDARQILLGYLEPKEAHLLSRVCKLFREKIDDEASWQCVGEKYLPDGVSVPIGKSWREWCLEVHKFLNLFKEGKFLRIAHRVSVASVESNHVYQNGREIFWRHHSIGTDFHSRLYLQDMDKVFLSREAGFISRVSGINLVKSEGKIKIIVGSSSINFDDCNTFVTEDPSTGRVFSLEGKSGKILLHLKYPSNEVIGIFGPKSKYLSLPKNLKLYPTPLSVDHPFLLFDGDPREIRIWNGEEDEIIIQPISKASEKELTRCLAVRGGSIYVTIVNQYNVGFCLRTWKIGGPNTFPVEFFVNDPKAKCDYNYCMQLIPFGNKLFGWLSADCENGALTWAVDIFNREVLWRIDRKPHMIINEPNYFLPMKVANTKYTPMLFMHFSHRGNVEQTAYLGVQSMDCSLFNSSL